MQPGKPTGRMTGVAPQRLSPVASLGIRPTARSRRRSGRRTPPARGPPPTDAGHPADPADQAHRPTPRPDPRPRRARQTGQADPAPEKMGSTDVAFGSTDGVGTTIEAIRPHPSHPPRRPGPASRRQRWRGERAAGFRWWSTPHNARPTTHSRPGGGAGAAELPGPGRVRYGDGGH
jgi:hypothetical protein